MKQQEVFKKIGGIIREINEQYEYLETVDGVLNELELELMVANSHFLTDHIEILRKLNAHAASAPAQLPPAQPEVTVAPIVIEEPKPEYRFFEPVIAQEEDPETTPEPITYLDEIPANTIEFEIPRLAEDHVDHFPEQIPAVEAEPEIIPEPEMIQTEAEPEPQTIRHELTLDDIGEDWDEDEQEEITPAPQPEPEPVAAQPEPVFVKPEPQPAPVVIQPEVKPVPQPVAAQHTQILVPEEQVLTLNERMSAQLNIGRMADHLGLQPITDLKSSITLNDKLLYIKDLFNGYGLAYSEAIDNLNRLKTFDEAESFLKATYATKNNWQDKQATADKFYALLHRRY